MQSKRPSNFCKHNGCLQATFSPLENNHDDDFSSHTDLATVKASNTTKETSTAKAKGKETKETFAMSDDASLGRLESKWEPLLEYSTLDSADKFVEGLFANGNRGDRNNDLTDQQRCSAIGSLTLQLKPNTMVAFPHRAFYRKGSKPGPLQNDRLARWKSLKNGSAQARFDDLLQKFKRALLDSLNKAQGNKGVRVSEIADSLGAMVNARRASQNLVVPNPPEDGTDKASRLLFFDGTAQVLRQLRVVATTRRYRNMLALTAANVAAAAAMEFVLDHEKWFYRRLLFVLLVLLQMALVCGLETNHSTQLCADDVIYGPVAQYALGPDAAGRRPPHLPKFNTRDVQLEGNAPEVSTLTNDL